MAEANVLGAEGSESRPTQYFRELLSIQGVWQKNSGNTVNARRVVLKCR